MDNVAMLEETLQILDRGEYVKNGKTVKLKLTREQMEHCYVLLPEDVQEVCARELKKPFVIGRCGVNCVQMDSFSAAIRMRKTQLRPAEDARPVLVLNFANPVHSGGGVRIGARAQEEDLCRKSSLLLSLESPHARRYYKYNRSLGTNMGSDAMIFTPKVEIIRDENGVLLDETEIVAVLTCAAPMIDLGLEGMSEAEYRTMFRRRITGILKCAAYFGYERLVLGAWGCGVFGNDAAVVSDLFYQALKELRWGSLRDKDLFRRIDFAVLGRDPRKYNLREFARNFGPGQYYREEDREETEEAEKKKRETEVHLDKVRGCLFGGAVGDALGYPVEFLHERDIFARCGAQGIADYQPDPASGKALISDDTQMTLFTANGILIGDTRLSMRGIGGVPHYYIPACYQDWLKTQQAGCNRADNPRRRSSQTTSWLMDVPELYHRRAPGNTCLSALEQRRAGNAPEGDFLENPINHSKGCGGIMRVAPLGLKDFPYVSPVEFAREAAQIAAITHGHSLGYMPAAVLALIIRTLVYAGKPVTIKEAILDAQSATARAFEGDKHLPELMNIIDLAITLSENGEDDLSNIHRLGEGWVAEETLGISLYCALRHQTDFSAGVIAAVNHNGDSDSTGAVTGNILGALLGYEAIEDKWKRDLELSDVILEMADDLCHGCQMEEYSHYVDPDWERKYMYMRWKNGTPTDDDTAAEQSPEEFIRSPSFDKLNRMLRDGAI